LLPSFIRRQGSKSGGYSPPDAFYRDVAGKRINDIRFPKAPIKPNSIIVIANTASEVSKLIAHSEPPIGCDL
jgi:hypothetical protein